MTYLDLPGLLGGQAAGFVPPDDPLEQAKKKLAPLPIAPGQIRLPAVDLPEPKGVLANPLAPLFAGQYPSVEKYNGVAPAPNGQLGAQSNLGDVLGFDQQRSQLQGRLSALAPDQMMQNVAASQAMAGHGYSDMERSRFQGVAEANKEGARAGLGAMQIGQLAAKDYGQGEVERAKLKLETGGKEAALNLQAKELQDRVTIENIRRGALRDQALERYLSVNPNAQPQQVETFIKQLDAARDLAAEDKGFAPPGAGGLPSGQGGAPVGLDALKEQARTKLKQTQEEKLKNEAALADQKNVQGVTELIAGKDYNVPRLLEALGNDARLVNDPVSLDRIATALKSRFGANAEPRKDLLKAMTLAHNESTGNSGEDYKEYGNSRVGLRKHSGLLGLSSGYNLERGGKVLAEMPKWYAGPGAGLVSPNETVFPTWKAGTKAQHGKNASILADILAKLYE